MCVQVAVEAVAFVGWEAGAGAEAVLAAEAEEDEQDALDEAEDDRMRQVEEQEAFEEALAFVGWEAGAGPLPMALVARAQFLMAAHGRAEPFLMAAHGRAEAPAVRSFLPSALLLLCCGVL